MKKALLTLGLFSMMMLLTSFTTTPIATTSQNLDQTETGGVSVYTTKDHKKADYTSNQEMNLSNSSINSESYKILYSNTNIKKLD